MTCRWGLKLRKSLPGLNRNTFAGNGIRDSFSYPFHAKGSLNNKLPILGVESPVRQGVEMQAYREYVDFPQRSRAG
jgi:hypothetical protein